MIAADPSESLLHIERAGFWRRLVAMIIDGVVVGVVEAVISFFVSPGVQYGVSFVVSAGYFTYFHGSTGRTPGDAAMSIQVVDLRDGTGRPIGYGRAFLRWLVSIASALVLFVGYFWMLWDKENQTWHDKAAGSAVVDLSDRV